jgi:hypothetical protein
VGGKEMERKGKRERGKGKERSRLKEGGKKSKRRERKWANREWNVYCFSGSAVEFDYVMVIRHLGVLFHLCSLSFLLSFSLCFFPSFPVSVGLFTHFFVRGKREQKEKGRRTKERNERGESGIV